MYVTDGGHVFNANLRQVENLIHQQNKWVAGTGKHFVTIVVLVVPNGSADTRHAVEGAYLAQYEANHPTDSTTGSPLVRLVLADDRAWQPAVTALHGQHPMAVIGLGSGDADLAHALAGRHIAMVGTGDLAGIHGLVRVTPTYPDEVSAAIRFLDTRPDRLPARPRMWLMQDENPADAHAIALGDAYAPAVRNRYQIVGPGSEYDSGVPAAATVLTASAAGGGDGVCRAHVNVLYFAGTGPDLRRTLTELGHRSCARTQPLTVLTSSDAAQIAGQPDLWSASANMTVYFTALASPGMWRGPALADPATTAWFTKAPHGFSHMFPAEPATALDDDQAIVSHDEVLTAISPERPVHGASGYLCFDKAGNPLDRAIPIVQLSSDGGVTYRGVTGPVIRC
ncbi:MAG TPA: hypothetical protein VFX16_11300 [Pseudonocardiaceae bacterium]|nr:hypothetical protein [Pseudonocardiaceae bacterium]